MQTKTPPASGQNANPRKRAAPGELRAPCRLPVTANPWNRSWTLPGAALSALHQKPHSVRVAGTWSWRWSKCRTCRDTKSFVIIRGSHGGWPRCFIAVHRAHSGQIQVAEHIADEADQCSPAASPAGSEEAETPGPAGMDDAAEPAGRPPRRATSSCRLSYPLS